MGQYQQTDNWLYRQTIAMFHHVTKIVSIHLGTCHQSANDVSALFLEFSVLTDDRLSCFRNPSYLESPHQILTIGAPIE